MVHALDLVGLQKVVWRDETIPTGCMLPSVARCEPFPELDRNIPAFDFDPDRARLLLNQAGYSEGFELTLYGP